MDLRVTHETHYDYTPAVETAQHVAYLQPLDTPYQTLLSHRLDVSPTPAQTTQTDDIYGNRRVFFSLQTPHTELRVVARSEVRTRAPEAVDSRIGWETLREQFRYHAGAAWSSAAEFSFASARAPRHEAFAAYARPSFGPDVSALAGARDLMQRIHADFTYETASTEVNTPPLEALAQRKGVCQDFAHIMLGCLRSLGLAARYVSGYLLTQPAPGQPRLVGSDASHAWVSIFLPDLPGAEEGQGWYDLDPTNDRDGWGTPGEDYVTVATGRDYADISPIRGVIHGGGQHTLTVAVTVEPVDG
ncbi:transglutaminase family protein [Bradyrhizobium sp.]|uniref:transglutaminase family protein n=1 Tax=Bradyrhizobium sp. TaxID=376 RepID=UPI0027337DBF|nr:transglutaminase family protein [Bradyrhizobium sp.]MDP3690578.1 transglutaminase family protein [Bradyrhizobium sp.]